MRVWEIASLLISALLAVSSILQAPQPGAGPANQARPSFSEFLAGVRAEALARGIRPDILDEALANIAEPVPTVIERDRSQAETVLSLEKYVTRLLTPEGRRDRPRQVRQPSRPPERGIRPLRCTAGSHRRHLGARVELRPFQRGPADGRGSGHARVGSAAVDALSQRAVATRSKSSTAATSTWPGCAGRGPARWDRRSSCRPAI